MARPKKNTEKLNKVIGSTRPKDKKSKDVSDIIDNSIATESVATDDILTPPNYLNRYARAKWSEIAKELEKRKVISNVDKTALEILSLNYGIALESYNAMINASTDGTIAGYINGRNSQMMGEYNAYEKSMKIVQRLLLEFGLTPASRSRVPEPETEKVNDPIADMINK